ncbi:MAG: hypothetical protein LBK07_03235 [Tannerella sp.]|jgi:hypothetical protein|nr:hypothetical protein [Tannerella sp.]
MTTVIIDNNSRTGRRLLKDIARHPRVARIVDERDNMLPSTTEDEHLPPDTFREDFENDCREALTPSQFMTEMEQRIRKW